MFWSKNKKKVYPCKPQFYHIKVGCKGVFVTRTCFRDVIVRKTEINTEKFKAEPIYNNTFENKGNNHRSVISFRLAIINELQVIASYYCNKWAKMCLVKLFMAPESKMDFGYIVGKLIICGFRNQWNYFSKEVRKVFI